MVTSATPSIEDIRFEEVELGRNPSESKSPFNSGRQDFLSTGKSATASSKRIVKRNIINHSCRHLRQAYFLGIFKKLKAQKTQPLKNSRPFFAEKLNMSGFFEASYKNSMQMTSISVHCLKQMVSIDKLQGR